MTPNEVADVLGISREAVYSRLRRAIPAMRAALEADTLFARLDDESTDRTDSVFSDDEAGDNDREESEDALDLWTVLYGLE